MVTISKRSKAESEAELAAADNKRLQFESAVEALYKDVQVWSKSENWPVERKPWIASMTPAIHAQGIDTLEITLPHVEGNLLLQPIGHDIAGADGRVDLLAYPISHRVRLLLTVDATTNKAAWIVRTDSGIDWPYPWNEETFKQLALALVHGE